MLCKRRVSYQHGVVLGVVQVHAERRVVGVRLQNVFDRCQSRRHKEGIQWFPYGTNT